MAKKKGKSAFEKVEEERKNTGGESSQMAMENLHCWEDQWPWFTDSVVIKCHGGPFGSHFEMWTIWSRLGENCSVCCLGRWYLELEGHWQDTTWFERGWLALHDSFKIDRRVQVQGCHMRFFPSLPFWQRIGVLGNQHHVIWSINRANKSSFSFLEIRRIGCKCILCLSQQQFNQHLSSPSTSPSPKKKKKRKKRTEEHVYTYNEKTEQIY